MTEGMTPYQRVLAALKFGGFLRGGRPQCPTCPPTKRRGFDVTEARTPTGRPTVLLKCFRGCDMQKIVEAIGLDPADLYDGSGRQEVLFESNRYCRVTTEGWKALPPSVARTFGIAASIGFYATIRSAYTLLRSPAQWDAVRREADIGDRLLRKQVEKWIESKVAHRCATGVLALYRGPLDRCPNCGRLTLEQRRGRYALNALNAFEPLTPTPEGSTTTRKYAENGTKRAAFRHDRDTRNERNQTGRSAELSGPLSRGGAP